MGLIVRDVSLGYGKAPVIEGVSFEARPGELLGVVGPNASGKTTLLRGLAGILRPSAGSIEFDGSSVSSVPARQRARSLSVVQQAQPMEWAFTVREFVEMGRTPYLAVFGRSTAADRLAVVQALEWTGISGVSEREVTTLSSGQLQLAVLARALAQEPRVMLLDEPTAHLDLTHQLEVMETVAALVRERSLTAVAVLHDLNLAARYCQRILVLSKGRARALGPPGEALSRRAIQAAFGIEVSVRKHPTTGATYVVPLAVSPGPPDVGDRPTGLKVHVICGGGTAEQLLPQLVEAGFDVSAGVVNVLDTDFEVAQSLGVAVVAEAPFSSPTQRSLSEARALALAAGSVVVTSLPVGPGNLAVLDIADAALAGGRKVFVIYETPVSTRDYTGGAATKRIEALVSAGAVAVASASEVVAALSKSSQAGPSPF